MPSFDPEAVVDPMRFRLKPDGEWRVVPEPSSVQVQAFLNARRVELDRLQKELAGGEDETVEASVKRLSPQAAKAARKRSAKIYADLCSGCPSAEELEEAPHRVYGAFVEWITKEVLDPEAGTGAGDAQVINLPSAAAG